eukprot:TRINITY_DN108978_c0_g1_i1.p1 TRINITY_DN108978_c0_g1~~TRINITY_DN108978_c0_g1_i1.p1  ORF type:complete len:669 (+),score=107.63 TRINITY_DN108978_c0_g1_i1:222-2009(+)
MIMFATFIGLTLILLHPFQCLSGPNGIPTMIRDPALRCYTDADHIVLVALAVVGLLAYPVAGIALTFWATWTYQLLASSPAGAKRLKAFRFIFARFKVDCYQFGVFFILRNFCIALTPTALVAAPSLQTLVMAMVLLISFYMQARYWPWRTVLANRSEACVSFLMIILLIGLAPFQDPTGGEEILGSVLAAITVGILASAVAGIVNAIRRHFWPSDGFSMFLCHHKAGAGVLARQLKMLLANQSQGKVFLDSDQLEDLDLIFDTVRGKTKNLVILLSPEVLTRMWCAGEIVTAHVNRIPIVVLKLDGMTMPTTHEIRAIPSSWTNEQQATLQSFDISLDMVTEAYAFVMTVSFVHMDRFAGLDSKAFAISSLSRTCHTSSVCFSHSSILSSSRPSTNSLQVIVTGAVTDAEALAACEIMQLLMQKELQVAVEVIRDAAAAAAGSAAAKVFLVLLSHGLLEDPHFAALLLAVMKNETAPHIVTISADTKFAFPTGEFLTMLEAKGLGRPGLGTEEGPLLSAAFRALLSILALPFSPLASEALINSQVTEISRRVSKLLTSPRRAGTIPRKLEVPDGEQPLTQDKEAPDPNEDSVDL